MRHTKTAIDKAAQALGGALILLGVVVLGLIETLAGPPYGAAPTTNDAGEVIATPLVDPALRTGLVLLGLVVLFAWGLYEIYTPAVEGGETTVAEVTAD